MKRNSAISIVAFKIGFNNFTNFEGRAQRVILIFPVVQIVGDYGGALPGMGSSMSNRNDDGNHDNQAKGETEDLKSSMAHAHKKGKRLKELGGASRENQSFLVGIERSSRARFIGCRAGNREVARTSGQIHTRGANGIDRTRTVCGADKS